MHLGALALSALLLALPLGWLAAGRGDIRPIWVLLEGGAWFWAIVVTRGTRLIDRLLGDGFLELSLARSLDRLEEGVEERAFAAVVEVVDSPEVDKAIRDALVADLGNVRSGVARNKGSQTGSAARVVAGSPS